jgi:hypothetical protein
MRVSLKERPALKQDADGPAFPQEGVGLVDEQKQTAPRDLRPELIAQGVRARVRVRVCMRACVRACTSSAMSAEGAATD